MGTVWRARDVALDRDVALKEVRPPDPAVEEANPGFAAQLRERAVREAQALARVSNPHVVTIHHIVEPRDGSHPWIVMELVEGSSVYDRLAAGPMPVPEVLALGRQVLSALRAAHAAGIQHRDVKPANVLLRHEGGAVLTDFGIAAFDGATSRLTSTGDLIGSPEFIAPERVRGEEGNPASDLWSLGMLLYVAAEGHHPLRRATGLATVVAVLDDPIPAPVRSGALGPVLTRLLVRDPAQRPDGALLERLLAEAEAEAEAEAQTKTAGGPGAAPTPGAAPAAPPHASVAGPATPPPYAPAPGPYPHPAYGPPVAPGAGFGPPTLPTPTPSRPRKRAAGLAVGLVLAAAAVVGVVNLFPGDEGDDGSGGTSGAKGGVSPTGAVRTPGQGPGTGTGSGTLPTASASTSASASAPATRGTLLTTANVRAVIEEFRRASGTTTIKDLTIYEEYALANIPTRPGAKTYDAYQYRAGTATKTGPGGTISADDADEQPFDVAAMPWDDLPALMKRGDRDLKVDDPTLRYVIVDRWTFNDDRPTLRYYLTNDYRASGYLAVDVSGKVVSTLPAS